MTCPNQDVVYGLGFFSLDEEPVVIQVPDFGDRFWIYALYDARTDQFAQIGKPYGTKPGFYLLVGPNWKGEAPAGIAAIVRSSTELANAIPRVFLDDTARGRAAIQTVLDQIVAYPLDGFRRQDEDHRLEQGCRHSRRRNPRAAARPSGSSRRSSSTSFGTVLDTVAPLPGEEAMYAQFRALLAAAAKDPAVKQTLIEAAVEPNAMSIAPFFEWKPQRPAGRQRLEPLDQQCAVRRRLFQSHRHGEVEHVRQQADRDAVFLHRQRLRRRSPQWQQHLRGDLRAGTGTSGQRLLVAHALQRTSFLPPERRQRYSLGTKNKKLVRNADGSLTIYVSAKSPGADKEANWLPAPDGPSRSTSAPIGASSRSSTAHGSRRRSSRRNSYAECGHQKPRLDGPVVIDIPEGSVAGLVDDMWQRPVIDLGQTGPDKGTEAVSSRRPWAEGKQCRRLLPNENLLMARS